MSSPRALKVVLIGLGILATVAGIAALYNAHGSGPYALQAFLLIAIGTTLGIAGVVNERRGVPAAVRISEERARKVIEGAHEAFVSIDAHGMIRDWNAAAESTFGWERGDAIGRELAATIIPERLRDAHRAGLAGFLQSGEGPAIDRLLEMSALHHDGHEFPVELTIAPQRIGDGWVFNAFLRDVTDRVAAEQELRLQGEIMSNMAEGVVMVRESDARIVFANRMFERMFGYEKGELFEQPVAVVNPPAERDPAVAPEIQPTLSHDGLWSGDVQKVKRDGTPLWCRVNVSNFDHPEHGEVSVVVHADITERKAMQEELERSNEELQEFAYVASHDLNEPLRVIGGFVELLQRRYGGQLDEQADGFLDATVNGVERMQAMIDALLEYSRVGRAAAEQELVDCDRAVQGARFDLDRLISEHGAELRVGALPDISGDPTLISQLFQNLISNAVKYGDADQPSVEVSAARRNGEWIFSVEDNGAGVDPGQAERVFEMFKRLHSRDAAGTGIGLAICKRIVERHGGRIWVEPREAGGSAFRFALPAEGTHVMN